MGKHERRAYLEAIRGRYLKGQPSRQGEDAG